MDRPVRILLCSAILALLAEAALLVNWRILAPHIESDAGVFTMVWVWPLCWAGLVVLAVLCLLVERMHSTDTPALQTRGIAIAMVMRLLIPVLLLVSPAIILLYAVVMVLMAAGVTAPPA
jgi:hypothetical protein